jgi:hypothetical protein
MEMRHIDPSQNECWASLRNSQTFWTWKQWTQDSARGNQNSHNRSYSILLGSAQGLGGPTQGRDESRQESEHRRMPANLGSIRQQTSITEYPVMPKPFCDSVEHCSLETHALTESFFRAIAFILLILRPVLSSDFKLRLF